MNTVEEQLWNYIDGNCTPEEKLEIEAKLAINIEYHSIYQELLKVNDELKQLDFEEPSMSFTRNVMEEVSRELKPVALKTKVDNRIIYSIAAFFVISLAGIFVYSLATSSVGFTFKVPIMSAIFNVDKYINRTSIFTFLFVDVVLALVYLDSVFRKHLLTKSLRLRK